MGKLTTLKPKLGSLPSRLGYLPGDEKAQDKSRNAFAPWRAWYGTKRWAQLKARVHLRDHYRCQRTGTLCAGRYPDPRSPVANHIKAHKGDPVLFWDERNIETVTKEYHDSIIQAEERAGEHTRGA